MSVTEFRPAEAKAPLFASILVTLFCCQPIGIAGIVFSLMSNAARKRGAREDAKRNAELADNCVTWAFFLGILAYGVILALEFIAATSS